MLTDVKNKFLQHLKDKRKAAATIVAYGKDIEQLIDSLKTMDKTDIETVTREDLSTFVTQLKEKKFTPKTISRKINSIKTFYRYLQETGAASENLATELSHPHYELKTPRILNKLEYRALRDVVRNDPRTFAVIELFLQAGLRISEVADMKIEDIKDSMLTVEKRRIPLNAAVSEALTSYLKVRPEKSINSHVFVTKSGKPLLVRNIRTVIDRALKVAGIENVKVNDLRVTFIAHQLAAGAPIDYISKLVGHKRISTTERYIGLVQEKPKKGAKLVEL